MTLDITGIGRMPALFCKSVTFAAYLLHAFLLAPSLVGIKFIPDCLYLAVVVGFVVQVWTGDSTLKQLVRFDEGARNRLQEIDSHHDSGSRSYCPSVRTHATRHRSQRAASTPGARCRGGIRPGGGLGPLVSSQVGLTDSHSIQVHSPFVGIPATTQMPGQYSNWIPQPRTEACLGETRPSTTGYTSTRPTPSRAMPPEAATRPLQLSPFASFSHPQPSYHPAPPARAASTPGVRVRA